MTTPTFAVLICEPMAPQGLTMLQANPSLTVDIVLGITREDLLARIANYDAVLVRSATKIDKEVIARAPKLKLIGRAGVGIDNIDIVAAKEKKIAVINTPSGNSISAAELAFTLMLSLARDIPAANAHVKSKKWDRKLFSGRELFGKTLGILGFGNVGQNLAKRAQAFEMKVICHDPWVKPEICEKHNVKAMPLLDMLSQLDFLSLHCGLSDETKNIIDEKHIKAMKKGAMIINTARGELIDDHALITAIDAGHIAGAALDVFRKEPPDASDPLLSHNKIIVTPHLGASTVEAQLRVSTLLAEQTIAFFAGSTNLTRVV